jgi:glutamine synthetase
LIRKKTKKDDAIIQVLRKYVIESKPIRFEGNNYSENWLKEAESRGLKNVTNVPDALSYYLTEPSEKLFASTGVLDKRELEARTEVRLEIYTKKVQIEARVLGDLAINHIIPTAIRYQSELAENIKNLKEILGEDDFNKIAANRIEMVKEISHHITNISSKVNNMVEERKKANKIEDVTKKAKLYSKNVFPCLDDIRYHIDKLELIVDNDIWPLPKYRELLFTR